MKNRTKSYDISSFKNLSINGKISLFGGNAGKNNEEKKRGANGRWRGGGGRGGGGGKKDEL